MPPIGITSGNRAETAIETNKDKSHLIDQLYDYLEEQIQELKTDRNQLNHKMQDMIQIEKEIHEFQMILREKEDKKTENMIAIEATTKNKVGFDTYA